MKRQNYEQTPKYKSFSVLLYWSLGRGSASLHTLVRPLMASLHEIGCQCQNWFGLRSSSIKLEFLLKYLSIVTGRISYSRLLLMLSLRQSENSKLVTLNTHLLVRYTKTLKSIGFDMFWSVLLMLCCSKSDLILYLSVIVGIID